MATENSFPSDPNLLLEFCASLFDLNGFEIQKKVNRYLQDRTGAELVFLVPLLPENEEALVQVLGDNQLDHELRFPVRNNILHVAVKRRCSITASSSELDPELHNMLKNLVTPDPTSFLIVPIFHAKAETVRLLACIVNYGGTEEAQVKCTVLVSECFRYCIGTVLNALAYEEEKRLKLQCQSLLSVAKNLFSRLGDFTDLMREIMAEARTLTNAERCSLFIVDQNSDELVAKIFDGEVTPHILKEVRVRKGQGIAGWVAKTGEVINVRDAYSHPLFYRGIDEATGYRTRNILCFPIHHENVIVGVAQMCNKRNGYYFDVFDEEVAMAFSIYCGISIMHSLVYKKIQEAQARYKMANELMMYHMKVNAEDVQNLLNCKGSHDNKLLLHWSFSPRTIPVPETTCYVFKFFEDLNLVNHFQIDKETLSRFILLVKKGYRDTPYHNWMHAFSVAHFAFLLVKNLDLINKSYITALEGLAFIISCLCHDLDHRGTNNSFQTESGTVLASLYSSEGSVMERHHLAQTLCILNTDDCNVLDGLDRNEYTTCLDIIRDIILATDLAHHLRVLKEQRVMVSNGFDKSNDRHRKLLLFLLMTAADLSDQTKDWQVSRQIAELIYEEFFSQGDLEKSMGNKPLEMMDRENARIPELQIQFLEDIVIPVFELLSTLFPEAKCLYDASWTNKLYWMRASQVFVDQRLKGQTSMEILRDPDLVASVLRNSPPK
ncbi:cGMP-dependent 3',5'-cyclic phosphodiesterase-like [Schistocerca americana]|uniref:cGMP-dependent 3',5'-cyclic phosphodiesterase-like n=1 Tax=Schistocerca americana TaxID=7009 RepID=UPI001F4FE34A|nr:cGMP-dependent 3',5'-cyclic phosphodiesterase-like [Schistocerca americana]XP_047119877.1 cGMP-dependent 3',5'-cyclic phosphodiesterase-like [Schistocerca piceifrons]XP_049940421.1 cGMP-dependent 3',5'-cyclic phosphodiesterase-like [Schistocerca serialis cubense]